MAVSAAVKQASKRIVDYPECTVEVISTRSWLSQFWTNPIPHVVAYLTSLLPILTWIHRYIVVPQGMSYAHIATLPPEYGLYSAVVGVFIYCIFATSKDVSIGPTAVMSLTVANVIAYVQSEHPGKWDNPTIATAAALIMGFVVLGIGLLRIGWLVEFIPVPAVSGFTTGCAITIVAAEMPGLLGITGFDNRAVTYHVMVNTLKGLPRIKLDAAWGLPGLVALYAIRELSTRAAKKWPQRARLFFFVNVFRNAFVILVMTIAAFLYCRKRADTEGDYPIQILKSIPPGLQHVGLPRVNGAIASALAPQLPVATVILCLEHIAISKTLGRMNGYKINPNQELVASGVANTVGACFGAYPCSGSFCRSALASRSGMRSPLGGIFTSLVVIVALYGLTSAFYWIPNSALCAIIIHAIAGLVASPDQVFRYWRISPLEFFIWVATVVATIFVSIQAGVYTSVFASLCLLLLRIAHPRSSFLGKVSLESESGTGNQKDTRDVFVPMKENSVLNYRIKVVPPAPGVLVYRFEESYLYPNCSIANSELVDYVKENMRRGNSRGVVVPLRDRRWNDNGPRHSSEHEQALNQQKPRLHAIVLDFSSVSHVDTTATQALIDIRTEIEDWIEYPVEFHFATILSPWIRRALVAGGFGYGTPYSKFPREVAAVIPHKMLENRLPQGDETSSQSSVEDIETGAVKVQAQLMESDAELRTWEPLLPEDTPFFHLDLQSAVRAAESGLDRVTKFDHKDSEGV
ncbi:hypothetical protein NP233_g5664 [Leucocoprinus birnbaumii]|uniref:STAS domain-containing protein n=1 Tax=Leucocoprinus birnbaumii TaxID=56174 RepID=A0AAD5VV39_9AGAR|nr:hypothetical protein NP233_g5664 [Leucocoprinus birnbaumii]